MVGVGLGVRVSSALAAFAASSFRAALSAASAFKDWAFSIRVRVRVRVRVGFIERIMRIFGLGIWMLWLQVQVQVGLLWLGKG